MPNYVNLTGNDYGLAGGSDETVIIHASEDHEPVKLIIQLQKSSDNAGLGANEFRAVMCTVADHVPERHDGVLYVAPQPVVEFMNDAGRNDFVYLDEVVAYQGNVGIYKRLIRPVDADGPDDVSDPETDLASGSCTFHASSEAFLESLRDRA